MRKIKLLILCAIGTLSLQSCVKDAVVCTVEVEYCHGGKDTVEYRGYTKPRISTYRHAVPILDGTNGWNNGRGTVILNVCKFRVLNN